MVRWIFILKLLTLSKIKFRSLLNDFNDQTLEISSEHFTHPNAARFLIAARQHLNANPLEKLAWQQDFGASD